ncbi:hypothetical protein [Spirosoma aerolatum]|uniref:hypothetical protein n=1 Tax=Spirosoma aerolatum TaxID=1211326 RepID=UPI001FE54D99|nr:hypothetical protein [Spirosoma aerolatum]
MAIGTQLVRIRRSSDGQEIYQATTTRDTDVYPLNSAGQAAFEAAASAGGFTLTLDNGAVIPAGTRPPLIKPGGNTTPPFPGKYRPKMLRAQVPIRERRAITMYGGLMPPVAIIYCMPFPMYPLQPPTTHLPYAIRPIRKRLVWLP